MLWLIIEKSFGSELATILFVLYQDSTFGDEGGISSWDMAAQVLRRLEEFNPESDSVTEYVERAGIYFEANEVPVDKKITVFLSAVGGKTYTLLRSLLLLTLPQDRLYDDIVDALKKHYEPKPLVIAERFHFHRRNQATGESIVDYIAELQRLSAHYKFGDYLDQALRDRLVCGLRVESIQKRLLAETDLTLKKALELAQGMEAADRNTKSLKTPETSV